MSTLGAPLRARGGAGQAGLDSSAVRPITPGKAAPSGYSTMGTGPSSTARLVVARVLCGAVERFNHVATAPTSSVRHDAGAM